MNRASGSLSIQYAGEEIQLLPDKAVYWQRTGSLIVADLHFGKPAAFRTAGIPVPENSTQHDLDRLDQLIAETKSRRLIVLGDFFHSASGLQREMMNSVEHWCRRQTGIEMILIPGNHDKKSGLPPCEWRFQIVPAGWMIPPFSFHHEPIESKDNYVMAGHVHPAIRLRERFGPGIRAACFYFGSRCAILPAFGSFTGTRSIEPRAGERVFAIGSDTVIEVSSGASRSQKKEQR